MSDKLPPDLLQHILGDPDNVPVTDEVKFNTGPIGGDPSGLGCLATILAVFGLGTLGYFTGIFEAIFSFFGSLF
ncbi:MAG: hypothetical protein GC168_16495 [Candidatus Hydrogenedens sp.]|nr:hypothetical protein [Candidatus Hydrogenedens sp.]